MKNRLRVTDIVGRMGGEEFLVILPNTSEEEAIQIADNFRQVVNQTEFLNEDYIPFVVAVSGGVLEMTDDVTSVEDLLKRSDRLLYEAKESGRNMILNKQSHRKSQCR